MWSQPLAPVHSLAASAVVAAVPLAVLLILMGVLRKGGLLSSACALLAAGMLAVFVWRMPISLMFWSVSYGFIYALWSILWIVFNGLWLYNIAVETDKFDLLCRWMEQRASDTRIQVILVAFCFGALLEGSVGFGAPVAITGCMLLQLGLSARQAVVVALIANTAPVAFGGIGIPIVALAGVTGLDLSRLSAMVGRQLPFLSLILPTYLVLVIGGKRGWRQTWPAALVAGATFALAQFLVSNLWGPYAADVVASLVSITASVGFLRLWRPAAVASRAPADAGRTRISAKQSIAAWLPWALLSVVVILWSRFELLRKGQIAIHIPRLDNGVWITLYQKPYSAVYTFQPLAVGTAVLIATLLTAICFRVAPRKLVASAGKTLRQLRLPGLTVLVIVALAYLYNYSGMAYTIGATIAGVGSIFPFLSSYLGWLACFLSGSDTASNLLFGNLQVAAAHQLHLSPVLLAATNSSGAVAGKMISPQNIAIGVTTVGLVGDEGGVLRSTFWHSIIFAALIGLLACAQAYLAAWTVP